MKIQCPHCQSKFNAADEHEGKTVKCPKCGEAFKIVSIAAADEPVYPGTLEDGKNGLDRVSPLLGVFMAGGMIIVSMVIDEPFSHEGMAWICFGGGLTGAFIFLGLQALIAGSWQTGGKLDHRKFGYMVLGGMVLGFSVIAILRWEEAKDAWFVVLFTTNTTIKIVLLLVNIPVYILVARRVSPSFRRILAADLSLPHLWYELFHTLVFGGIYLVQYLLIKIIFLN